MAVAFASFGQNLHTGNTVVTASVAIGAGTDRYLLAAAGVWSQSVSLTEYSGIAFDPTGVNTAMSLVSGSKITGSHSTEFWGLALGSGASLGTLDVTATASPSGYLYLAALLFTGVHQSTPTANAGTASGDDNQDITIASATNDMVVATIVSFPKGTILSPGTSQSTQDGTHEVATAPGSASVVMDWNLDSGAYTISGLSLKAAGGAPAKFWIFGKYPP